MAENPRSNVLSSCIWERTHLAEFCKHIARLHGLLHSFQHSFHLLQENHGQPLILHVHIHKTLLFSYFTIKETLNLLLYLFTVQYSNRQSAPAVLTQFLHGIMCYSCTLLNFFTIVCSLKSLSHKNLYLNKVKLLYICKHTVSPS